MPKTSSTASRKKKPAAKPDNPVTAYAKDVVAGRIVAGKLVRLACERHLHDLKTGWRRGLKFDETDANHAIQFFRFLRHYKGRWAGVEFKLESWQMFIVGSLFGWKNADGKRRFKRAYVQIARKNGKTILAAGIADYMFISDGEPSAEVYCAATKRDQAKRLWVDASEFVKMSPALKKRVQIYNGSSRMVYGTSYFTPLGSNVNTLDSLNPHCAVVDEIHKLAKRRVWDAMETAMGARDQPLLLGITTAGFDQAGICYELRQYGIDILTGTVDAGEEFFAYIAEMDDGDDWQDERNWVKGNPNLGVSIQLEELRAEFKKAMAIPASQSTFRCDRLNQWVEQAEVWIPLDLWDANARDENGLPRAVDEATLAGRDCYGGLDLSQSQDLTSWCLLFPRDDGSEIIDCLFRFWTTRARLLDPENRYREHYQAWARQGLLNVIDGPAIDYNVVKAQIIEDAAKFHLIDFNVDRNFQGMKVLLEMQEEGFQALPMGMGHISFTAPCVEFERRLLAHQINHGGHPIMRWMMNGLAIKRDEKATSVSMKPVKGNKFAKIDGPVTLIMALDRVMRHQQAADPYEDGIIVG